MNGNIIICGKGNQTPPNCANPGDWLSKKQGHACRYAHHRPVERHEQSPLDQRVLLAPAAGEQVGVDIKEVAKDQGKGPGIEHGSGKQLLIACRDKGVEREVQDE
jgi:hypothetical protein